MRDRIVLGKKTELKIWVGLLPSSSANGLISLGGGVVSTFVRIHTSRQYTQELNQAERRCN